MATTQQTIQVDFVANTKPALGSVKDMMAEVKKLYGQLGAVNVPPLVQQETLTRIAKLKGEIEDAKKSVSMFDPGDTFGNFATMLGVANTAMVGVSASLKLFGADEKQIKEIQDKLNTAIQIGVVLQQLADTQRLKGMVLYYAGKVKEIAMRGIELGQMALLNVATKAQVVATELEGKATLRSAIAKKAATVAQWAWNAAMTANPIGLIIVAIAALAAAVYGLTKIFGDNTKAVAASAESYDALLVAMDDWDAAQRKASIEAALMAGQITQVQAKQARAYEEAIAKKKKADADYLKTSNEINKQLIDGAITKGTALNALNEAALKQDAAYLEANLTATQAAAQATKDDVKQTEDARLKVLSIRNKKLGDLIAAENQRYKIEKQALIDSGANQDAMAAALAIHNDNLERLRGENEKKKRDADLRLMQIGAIGIEQQKAIENKRYENEQIDMKDSGALDKEKEVAKKQHEQNLKNIDDAALNSKIEAQLALQQLQAQSYNELVSYEENRHAVEMKRLEDTKATQEQIELAEAQHNKNLSDLNAQRVMVAAEKVNTELDKMKEKIDKEPIDLFNISDIDTNADLMISKTKSAYAKLIEQAGTDSKLREQLEKNLAIRLGDINQWRVDKELEAEKLKEEKISELRGAAIEGFGTIMMDRISARYDEVIGTMNSDIEGGFAKEQKALDELRTNKQISDEQYNAKKAKLDTEYEKKKKQVQIETAKIRKREAIWQIIINTAVAVTKALADSNPLVAGVVAGLGAIQLGVVQLKPLPEYGQGGLLIGPSHAAGGITTPVGVVEGGEFVINKKQTTQNQGLLESINNSNGDMIKELSNRLDILINLNSRPTRAYVTETDITNTQDNVRKIKEYATI